MRPQGVIFDVDGTLLDSMPIWMDAGARYVRAKGKVPHEDLGQVLFAATMEEGALYLQKTYGIQEEIPVMIASVNRIVQDFYFQEVPLKPGVMELLVWLKDQGIPMTVATTTDYPVIEAAFSRLGIMEYFKEIFTCSQVGAGKDQPVIYQRAASAMGTEPGDTWVFEDGLHGLLTAKKAGFYTVGLYDEASKEKQKALKQEADLYGQTMQEILELLQRQG